MGIEGGGGGPEGGPKTINIEGEPISALVEIRIDESRHIPLPREIKWSDGRLVFTEVEQVYAIRTYGIDEEIKLYEAVFEYGEGKGANKVDLSREINRFIPCYFTGSANGFYAHDPMMKGKQDNFYVVGIQPDDLERDQRKVLSMDHELGHVWLMDQKSDLRMFWSALRNDKTYLPEYKGIMYAGIIEYARKLMGVILEEWKGSALEFDDFNRAILFQAMSEEGGVDKNIRLFHERFAWAAGINLSRGKGFPTGFEKQKSIMEYARFCLASYARAFYDKRFVEGFKKK